MKRSQWVATDANPIPHIRTIGLSADPETTRYGVSVRNQYIIHYVLEGRGIFNGNPVERGQGFLITPGLLEEYHPDPLAPWRFLWVISEDANMEYFFARHRADRDTGIFTFHNIHELEAVSKLLHAQGETPAPSTRLAEIFLHVFHSCIASEGEGGRSVASVYYEFSVNYIETNLHRPLTVSDICGVIGVSQPYLYGVFRQKAGCSPKRYILRRKLEEARRLLLQTSFSVSAIAAAVGFGGALDFSKFFAKETGMSPTAYRRAAAEG